MREAGTFWVAGAGSGGRSGHRGAEAAGRDSKRGHVFLGLKQDDVNLWSEEAAKHHRAAQRDGNAHGSGLHLSGGRGKTKFIGWLERGKQRSNAFHLSLTPCLKEICKHMQEEVGVQPHQHPVCAEYISSVRRRWNISCDGTPGPC